MLKVTYKVPKKDFCFEVRIGDLLNSKEDVVVSTKPTFDTDISNGLISPSSIQGQVVTKFFNGRTDDLDKQISKALTGAAHVDAISAGKKRRYPIGTVAKVQGHGKNLYFLAMAELNEHGNASSSPEEIQQALSSLWKFIAERGELGGVAIPVIGTGRGRLDVPRRKVIEWIAQSFAQASRSRVFANKLAIVIDPQMRASTM